MSKLTVLFPDLVQGHLPWILIFRVYTVVTSYRISLVPRDFTRCREPFVKLKIKPSPALLPVSFFTSHTGLFLRQPRTSLPFPVPCHCYSLCSEQSFLKTARHYYLISLRSLFKCHLAREIFLAHLIQTGIPISPKTLLSFLHSICHQSYISPLFPNYKANYVEDKSLCYSLLYPQDLKEHLLWLKK